MRNNVLIIFTIVLCTSVLYSFAATNKTYQAECISIATDGYVTLKIWDIKKGSNYKSEQARKNALYTVLFSGIAGGKGCTSQPPILSKAVELEKFRKIEKAFFHKAGKWSIYSTSSTTETTRPTNIGVKGWKVYLVSISKNELRKYLEETEIINSLNTGF
jgi:hypothetical protein